MSARRSGPVIFVAAAAFPVVLWHRFIADIASQFRLEPTYLLTGWAQIVDGAERGAGSLVGGLRLHARAARRHGQRST